ncbi:clumping factor B [Metarhizium robertsii ARSEF 23]|uniref:Clumping factor B n=1 Tax=Metarhizium robertsii (strain ARSEF 23 / ATCC MYA-3075) TaxID=655844 RepID=A0A0B2XHX3_METRA|nr:clumping factor B [Metarhizium robertsii ARSEF 23]KHO11107.1 clumping factor B [Metarhizium robertsii ARSEF 23]
MGPPGWVALHLPVQYLLSPQGVHGLLLPVPGHGQKSGAFALIAGAQGPHSTLPHKEDVWNIKAMDSMLHKAATLQATSRHVPPDQTRLAGKSQVCTCRAGASAAASWLAGLHQYYFQSSPLYCWWGYISMVNIELVPLMLPVPLHPIFVLTHTFAMVL